LPERSTSPLANGCADRLLHALLGLKRFPSADTIWNFFLRFTQGHPEAFWRSLWRWLLRLMNLTRTPELTHGWTRMDTDKQRTARGTVMPVRLEPGKITRLAASPLPSVFIGVHPWLSHSCFGIRALRIWPLHAKRQRREVEEVGRELPDEVSLAGECARRG
jgi:hypothetical protein